MKPRLRGFYALAIAIPVAAFAASAATVAVGSCRPNLQTYPTISQAAGAVAAGSTILVCPGVYREQVTITQPLTLTGVHSDNAANPVIAVPSGGLTQSVVAPANGATMFFQILVQGTDTGLVNINNIAVDGNNNQVTLHFGGPSWLSGIYYQNSSFQHAFFSLRAMHRAIV